MHNPHHTYYYRALPRPPPRVPVSLHQVNAAVIHPTVPCKLEGVDTRCPANSKKFVELWYVT